MFVLRSIVYKYHRPQRNTLNVLYRCITRESHARFHPRVPSSSSSSSSSGLEKMQAERTRSPVQLNTVLQRSAAQRNAPALVAVRVLSPRLSPRAPHCDLRLTTWVLPHVCIVCASDLSNQMSLMTRTRYSPPRHQRPDRYDSRALCRVGCPPIAVRSNWLTERTSVNMTIHRTAQSEWPSTLGTENDATRPGLSSQFL